MGFFKRKKKSQTKEAKYIDYFNEKDLDEKIGSLEWMAETLKNENEAKVMEVRNLEAAPYGSESLAESLKNTGEFVNSYELEKFTTKHNIMQLSIDAELAEKRCQLEKVKLDREIEKEKREALFEKQNSKIEAIKYQTKELEACYSLIETAEKLKRTLPGESKEAVNEILNNARLAAENIANKAKKETVSAVKLPVEYQKEEDEKERLRKLVAEKRSLEEKENETITSEIAGAEKRHERKNVDLQKIKRKEDIGKVNRRMEIIKSAKEIDGKEKDDYGKSM